MGPTPVETTTKVSTTNQPSTQKMVMVVATSTLSQTTMRTKKKKKKKKKRKMNLMTNRSVTSNLFVDFCLVCLYACRCLRVDPPPILWCGCTTPFIAHIYFFPSVHMQ